MGLIVNLALQDCHSVVVSTLILLCNSIVGAISSVYDTNIMPGNIDRDNAGVHNAGAWPHAVFKDADFVAIN